MGYGNWRTKVLWRVGIVELWQNKIQATLGNIQTTLGKIRRTSVPVVLWVGSL
jgi:hypothetical protein